MFTTKWTYLSCRELGEASGLDGLSLRRHTPLDQGRKLGELGSAELAKERWIAQLRSAPDIHMGEGQGSSARGRMLQQEGRPHKGQESEQTAGELAGSSGGWTDLGAPGLGAPGVPLGSGGLEERELTDAEAARMEELLALAEAVRGDGGSGGYFSGGTGSGGGSSGGTGVGFIEGQGDAAAAIADALKPQFLNDTESWSADTPNQLVRVSAHILLLFVSCV